MLYDMCYVKAHDAGKHSAEPADEEPHNLNIVFWIYYINNFGDGLLWSQ
jgi:hypothetical protein